MSLKYFEQICENSLSSKHVKWFISLNTFLEENKTENPSKDALGRRIGAF